MKYLKLEGQPYEDSLMEYGNHKYVIKKTGIVELLGSEFFGDMTNSDIEDLCKETRDKIYSYIKSESRRENFDITEYRIAKKNWRGQYQAREDLQDAMVAQIKYAIRSGGDMLGDHHGVNLKKGTMIQDWSEQRKKLEVSSTVERILKDGNQSLVMVQTTQYSIDPEDYRSDY